MSDRVDILYITYNRPHYVRLALPQLLQTCRENDRVWIWHNGDDRETLAAAREHEHHEKVARFEHSDENQLLRVPTNWFWNESDAPFIAKVDDDCLMPDGWIERLLGYHAAERMFGILSAWPFLEEDFKPEVGSRKVRSFNGYKVMVNPWTGGSGYIAKRAVIDATGEIREGQNFSGYCIQAALKGFVNGWPVPLICMDHMDDPRSPNTGLKSSEDFEKFGGLSAKRFGMESLEVLKWRTVKASLEVQEASPNPRAHVGLRAKFRRLKGCLKKKRYRRARFDT